MRVERLASGRSGVRSGRESRRRDLVELVVGYGLILLVIWTPRPWQQRLYTVAALFIVAVSWRCFRSWGSMGLRRGNLLRSSWIVGAALAVAGGALAVSSRLHALHGVGGPVAFCERYWGYALWAFLQQLLLQEFFLRRLLEVVPGRTAAVWVAAGMFAVAHLPNPVLVPVTLVWGLIACTLFLRYRNIFPLSIAHAVLGITLSLAIPGPVMHNMRVGLGYLTYRVHGHHRRPRISGQGHFDRGYRNQADQMVSTQAWVRVEAATRRS
jgi:hypothetical protein